MSNQEIEDYLAERGYELVNETVVDRTESRIEIYSNWRKEVIVNVTSAGVKSLFVKVDNLD